MPHLLPRIRAWYGRIVLPAWFHALPVHPAPLLAGLAAGWQWSGLKMVLAAMLDPLPATLVMACAIALLAAAVGPWLPRRFLLAVAHRVGRRECRHDPQAREGPAQTESAAQFWILRLQERDPSMLWLSMAILAAAAGAASLLMLMCSQPFARLHAGLIERFFWTNLTMAFFEWLMVALLISVPWLLTGLVVAALAPVLSAAGASTTDRKDNAWSGLPPVAGGVLLGAGLALLLHEAWADRGISAQQTLLASALAMFVLAAFSAWSAQQQDKGAEPGDEVSPCSSEDVPARLSETAAPETAPAKQANHDVAAFDAGPQHAGPETSIWVLLVILGAAGSLTAVGWLWCMAAVHAEWRGDPAGWLVILCGAGAASLAGRRSRQRRPPRSACGCGMALWAAGVAWAAVATLAARGGVSLGWNLASTLLQIGLLGISAGWALGYAEHVWLARAGSGPRGFARMTSAVLTGCAVGLIGGFWWLLPTVGPLGAMLIGALMMMAAGGLVQIHESDRPPHIRHLRLGLVFASLAAAILVFPANARRWDGLPLSQPAPPAAPADLDRILAAPRPSNRSICIISDPPAGASPNGSAWHAGSRRRGAMLSTASASDPPVRLLGGNVLQVLRLEHRQYDVIYQRMAPQYLPRFAPLTVEWLQRLKGHTLPGGVMVIELPLDKLNPAAVQVVSRTFHQVAGPASGWMVDDAAPVHLLRLYGWPSERTAFLPPPEQWLTQTDPPGRPRASRLPAWQAPAAELASLECLWDQASAVQLHSILRDQITPALKSSPVMSAGELSRWLGQRQLKNRF